MWLLFLLCLTIIQLNITLNSKKEAASNETSKGKEESFAFTGGQHIEDIYYLTLGINEEDW